MQKDDQYLVLVRHGLSLANVHMTQPTDSHYYEVSGSDLQVALTEKGREQAKEAGRKLARVFSKKRRFKALRHSPFMRVVESTDLIEAELGYSLDRKEDSRLKKRSYGIFWNVSYKGVEELFPEEHERFKAEGDLLYRPPEGENYFDVFDRIDDFIVEEANSDDAGNLLVVTHSVVMLGFQRELGGLSDDEVVRQYHDVSLPNGAILVFKRKHQGDSWSKWEPVDFDELAADLERDSEPESPLLDDEKDKMQLHSVSVCFEDTVLGRAGLAYAADLATGLGLRLEVFVCIDSKREETIGASGTIRDALVERLRGLVTAATNFTPGDKFTINTYEVGSEPLIDSNSILVDQAAKHHSRDAIVLASYDETAVRGRQGKGPIFVPFGDETAGMHAAHFGLPLAKTLGLSIVYYHTTWRDENTISDNPADHMCTAARRIQSELSRMATSFGVEHRFVIECADDVVEGMLQCAMREQAAVIVLARGARTGIGSYVTQSLAQSPIPCLVAPRRCKEAGGLE